MSRNTGKWMIFSALFMTAPTLLFLVQVVFFLPAAFWMAGIFICIGKVLSGQGAESLVFAFYLGVHAAVYFVLHYSLAALAAMLIWRLPRTGLRLTVLGALLLGLAALPWLPLYGGGGHGPIKWMSLFEALGPGYGRGSIPAVWGLFVLLVLALCGAIRLKRAAGRLNDTKS